MAAGLGKRLRPLTDARPKPLVPIFNKPLITFALDHLHAVGVENFVINTHHLADQFAAYFPANQYRGCPVHIEHELDLLETGGGIANVAKRIGSGAFLVYSGDILTDIDLQPLIDAHFRDDNDVTLALRETGLASDVACIGGRVVDVGGRYGHAGTHDFANVSVWNARAVEWIPRNVKVAFIPVLVDRIVRGARIGGVELNDRQWFNVGSRSEYLKVHGWIAAHGWRPSFINEAEWPRNIDPGARIAADAIVDGTSAIGADTEIGAGVVVKNSVIWNGAKIASGARLENCIVRDFQEAAGVLSQQDI